MVWLIIIGILIVAFGPLLWLMPSPRERRLARLRQRAYRHGMRVELRRLPRHDVTPEERVTAGARELDVTRETAAYVHPLAPRLRMLPALRVLRHGDGTSAAAGWAFQAGRRPEHPRLPAALEALEPVLDDLPDDVVGFETEPQSVAAYWLEGPQTTPEQVDDLAARLARAAQLLTELDARLMADTEPGNI